MKSMLRIMVVGMAAGMLASPAAAWDYSVVDTAQTTCYDNASAITAPTAGQAFYGQDAQCAGNQPSYTVSGDGLTVYDNVTGMTWQQGHSPVKYTFADAQSYVDSLNAQNYGGYSDWRVPTTKQLYSLMDFRGTDPNPMAGSSAGLTPFVNTDYFDFAYGDTSAGERIIDSQWMTTTLYVGNVFTNRTAMFGVNFADGRIKGYPIDNNPNGTAKTFYVRACRGNESYGTNDFLDNGNGSITDRATGLMWSQDDNGEGVNWQDALAWVQQKNAENYLGHDDWRLPDAKELQSLVDYTRSPDTTGSAAIDELFDCTGITNLEGDADFGYYWTGTSHVRQGDIVENAVYICFGRGMGQMFGDIQDVHGAGCQRSDPKDGDEADYPIAGMGPQGDVQRVFNFVRLVRDAELLGDCNGDGLVDAADYVTVKDNLGLVGGATWSDGDFDYDGDVDTDDLDTLVAWLGQSSAPSGQVPEPLSAALLAAGASGLLSRRLVNRL